MAESKIAPRLFEYHDGGSDKFWIVELDGTSHTVRYGRQGTDGQTKTKNFASEAEAQKSYEKLIAQKTKKGYVEAKAAGESRGEKLKAAKEDLKAQEPFLAEIRENPDDPAGYAVFADWLEEKGDPRGEFMNIQLQLENEKLRAPSRKKLQDQEKALLKKHQRDWLGDLAPFLLDNNRTPHRKQPMVSWRFARGFLDSVTVHYAKPDFIQALKKSSHANMLRELRIRELPYAEDLMERFDEYADKDWDWTDNPSLSALMGSQFENLRVFEIDEDEKPDLGHPSCHIKAEGVEKVIRKMPRLETLVLEAHRVNTEAVFKLKMPHLRFLKVHHTRNYALATLARNKSMTNLERIWFYPHALEHDEPYIRFADVKALCRSKNLTSLQHLSLYLTDSGDEGIKELIKSGLLARLKTLDMRLGSVTDEGAELLAAEDLSHLEELNLSENFLSKAMVKKLKGLGKNIVIAGQNFGTPEESDYLYMGDIE